MQTKPNQQEPLLIDVTSAYLAKIAQQESELARYVRDQTPEGIEAALSHPFWKIRYFVAQRSDIHFTKAQIMRGLFDQSALVRAIFAYKLNFQPPHSKILSLLSDDPLIVAHLISNKNISLTKRHENICLKHPQASVQHAVLLRTDFLPTPFQTDLISKSSYSFIREFLCVKSEWLIKPSALERLKKDGSLMIRASAQAIEREMMDRWQHHLLSMRFPKTQTKKRFL